MSGGGGDSDDEFEVNINLTALLDVLTNLLFFLMLGFAAQQANVEIEGAIELPTTTAETAPKKDVRVMVGSKELRVEGEIVATLRDGKPVAPLDENGRILPLRKKLTNLKEKRISSTDDADVLFVLCDRNAPYTLVRQVLMTAAESGFHKFRMGALME